MDTPINFQGLQLGVLITASDFFQQLEMRTLICVYFQIRSDMSFPPKQRKSTTRLPSATQILIIYV